MKLADTVTLAMSKYKLRRRRTIVASVTMGILFGIVIAILVISNNLVTSMDRMSSELFHGKIYVTASENINSQEGLAVINKAKELYENSVEPNKSYPLLTTDQYGNTITPTLDKNNPIARKAISQIRSTEVERVKKLLEETLEQYNGTIMSPIGMLSPKGTDIISIDSLVGHENTYNTPLTVLPTSMLKSLTTHQTSKDAIPVIVYSSYAKDILKLNSLPQNATQKELYKQAEYIREHAPGATFTGSVIKENKQEKQSILFQIVGVIPDNGQISTGDPDSNSLVDAALSSLTNSSRYGMITPLESTPPLLISYYEPTPVPLFDTADFIVSFNNVEDATKFIHEKSCLYVVNSCTDFFATEFITSRVALRDLSDTFNKIILWVAVFFCIIAILIMTGTLARIIDDERQSTAIYRALGATKKDVRKIYVAYSLIFCTLASLTALVIGYSLALIAHLSYAESISNSAKNVYGLAPTDDGIWLIGGDVRILVIVAIIFITGIFATLLMSAKIVSKDIIKDIKE